MPFLKQLEAARVPLLWRPFHEMNGTWFWWGGRRGACGTAAMYKMMFDRLVNYHQTLVNNPRSWSLSDPDYRQAVAPVRIASGLPAELAAPPVPAGPGQPKP